MKYITRFVATFVCLSWFYLIFPQKVHAYLDPGTGSYIIQIGIATLLGGLYLTKLFWNKIKAFIQKVFFSRKIHGKS
jgi:hypothetical protein